MGLYPRREYRQRRRPTASAEQRPAVLRPSTLLLSVPSAARHRGTDEQCEVGKVATCVHGTVRATLRDQITLLSAWLYAGGARLALLGLNRGLAEEFVGDLMTGPLARIVDTAKAQGLDLQVREDYINLYDRGLSLLELRHQRRGAYRAKIHVKFLRDVHLPGELRRDGSYATLDANGSFVERYCEAVGAISANANPYAADEASAEQVLVRDSLGPDSAMVIIDRQLQLHGIPRRADVIGLTREPQPRFIIGEVKCGLNNDIQEIPAQLEPYYRMLTDADGRLTTNATDVYCRVVEQKQLLGVLPADVRFPAERPLVECLAILCDYNPRSRLLGRARVAAGSCGFIIHLVQPQGPDYSVPPLNEWGKLCP